MCKINTYNTRAALLDSMERIARREVKHYFTDWTEYDAPTVAGMEPGTSWIWITRDCGTHLFKADNFSAIRAVLGCWKPAGVTARHLVIGPAACTLQKLDAVQLLEKCKRELSTMKEYKISYTAGTSPYWYNVSLYAYTHDEARELFEIRSDLCPYNVREIRVERV